MGIMLRMRALPAGFIAPCLPTKTTRLPSGSQWLHEIKHDGFRLMVRRDLAGVRLITRNRHDWSGRFPLIAQAASALRVRSFLIDGEAVACDNDGLPVFDRLRYRRADGHVFLYAFDLIELNGDDLRREPLEVQARLSYTTSRGTTMQRRKSQSLPEPKLFGSR